MKMYIVATIYSEHQQVHGSFMSGGYNVTIDNLSSSIINGIDSSSIFNQLDICGLVGYRYSIPSPTEIIATIDVTFEERDGEFSIGGSYSFRERATFTVDRIFRTSDIDRIAPAIMRPTRRATIERIKFRRDDDRFFEATPTLEQILQGGGSRAARELLSSRQEPVQPLDL